MLHLFTSFHLFLARHRPAVFVVMLAVCAAAGLLSASLEMDEDIMRMLPQDDPTVRSYFQAFKKLRHVDGLIVDIGIAQDNRDVLCRAADRMFEVIRQNPELTDVNYRFDPGNYHGSVRLLQTKLPNLLGSEDEYAALAESTEPEAIARRLEWLRQMLTKPQGFVVTDVAREDPLGFSVPVLKRLQAVQTGFGDTQIIEGRIASADGRHILITAMPTFASADLVRSAVLVDALLEQAHAIEASFSDYGVHIAVGGGHRVGLDNARLVKRDAGRALMVMVCAMVLLSFLSYRRRWLALITLTPTAVGAALAGAGLFFAGAGISGIAIGCGTILLGITVDYAIHVLCHLDNAPHRDRRSIAATIFHITPPIAFGALTTLGAFAVMMLSPVESHRQVGLFAIIGVATAAVFSILVLPIFVPLSKSSAHAALPMTRAFEKFFSWRSRHIPLLLLLICVLTTVGFVGLGRLQFEGDVAKLNGVTPEMQRDQDILWDVWGDAASMTTIMVIAPTMEEALEKNDRVADALSLMRRDGAVQTYSSLSPVCPSAARQQENINAWGRFWSQERRDKLQADLARLVPGTGFRLDRISASLAVTEQRPEIVTPADLKETILAPLVTQLIHVSDGEVAISTMARLAAPDMYERVEAAVRAAEPGATLLNRIAFSNHMAGLAKRGITTFALLVTIVDAIILALLLQSLAMVLVVFLPIAIGLVWTFGAMGILGVSVNIINFIFVIFVIGVGIDYSLFLVTSALSSFRGHSERLATTSGSISICALTTICGFGVLALARHPSLYSIGITAFLGMACTFAATLLLVPFGTELLLRRSSNGGTPKPWHLLGGVWCLVYLTTMHFVLMTLVIPVVFLLHPRNRVRRSRLLRRIAHPMLSGLTRTFPYGKVTCTNLSRSVFSRPAIVISNHQSIVDIPLLVRLPCDLRLTIKDQWWSHALTGASLSAMGHIRVQAGDPEGMIRDCSQAFAEGSSVLFFPEGTRRDSDARMRFRKGAFELAIRLNADILPVVLCDSWTSLPRHGMWVERARIRMRALPRITPHTFDYSLGARAMARHAAAETFRAWKEELECNNTPAILRRKVDRLYRYQGPKVELGVFFRLRRDRSLPFLHSIVPPAGLVLDLGCGYGAVTHWLAQASPERRLLGIDHDANRIHVARCSTAGSPRVTFEQHDFHSWPLPQCMAVLLIDAITDVSTGRNHVLLCSIFDALLPEGRLILRVSRTRTKPSNAVAAVEMGVLRKVGYRTVDVVGDEHAAWALLVAHK